jgi:hypothetical protein
LSVEFRGARRAIRVKVVNAQLENRIGFLQGIFHNPAFAGKSQQRMARKIERC